MKSVVNFIVLNRSFLAGEIDIKIGGNFLDVEMSLSEIPGSSSGWKIFLGNSNNFFKENDMFKKTLIVGVSVLSLAFAGAAFAAGNGAETIVLKGGSMGNVTFPHKAHQDNLKDCEACHKLFPKEAGAIEKGIADGTLKKKEVMKNCESCHKATKAKGEATGPTSCKGCHKK